MRILFISAFYPPAAVGGWEQLVEEINERLVARGHTTHVLTSTCGAGAASAQRAGIDYVLGLESDLAHYDPVQSFLRRRQRWQCNLSYMKEAISRFNPDVVFVHVMWNLSKAVPWKAEQLRPGRVVYYVADHWPYTPDVHAEYWRQPAERLAMKLPKYLVARAAMRMLARETKAFPLQFRHVLCVSKAIRDNLVQHAGIAVENARVIYNGIDLDPFGAHDPFGENSGRNGELSLLYAGSLVPHKGVHTAIEAMRLLNQAGSKKGVSLTIVGSGHPDYEAGLRELVAKGELAECVQFRGRVPREGMPAMLREFDVLVFPSIWEEPLARMVQEAMAAGLVVVGTTTGGTKEILIEGETGLTFEAGDAGSLAGQIGRLAGDPELCTQLRQNARERVIRDFDIRRMIDEIEQYLSQVADIPSTFVG